MIGTDDLPFTSFIHNLNLYMDQYGPNSDYEDGLKLRITDIDKRLANLLKDVEAGNSSDIIRNRMIDLQNQKKLLEEELKIEEGRKRIISHQGQF